MEDSRSVKKNLKKITHHFFQVITDCAYYTYVPNLLHSLLGTLYTVNRTVFTLYYVPILHIYNELYTHNMFVCCIILYMVYHTPNPYTYTLHAGLWASSFTYYYHYVSTFSPQSCIEILYYFCGPQRVVVNGSSNAFFTVRGMVKLRVWSCFRSWYFLDRH